MAPRAGVNIRINNLAAPVRVLGYGERVGIWVQGCTIGCRGCVAVDTWDADPRFETTVDEVLTWVRSRDAGVLDGVTISGGEPFEQPVALRELIRGLRVWRDEIRESTGRDLDLLCYSGISETTLRAEHADILELLDVVIPEPFVKERAATIALRGSDNQRIVPLTELGSQRYTGDQNLTALAAQRERLQTKAKSVPVRIVGIPRGDDVPATVRELAARGIRLTRRDDS